MSEQAIRDAETLQRAGERRKGRAEGHEEGFKAGKVEGYDEGFKAGHEAGYALGKQVMAEQLWPEALRPETEPEPGLDVLEEEGEL